MRPAPLKTTLILACAAVGLAAAAFFLAWRAPQPALEGAGDPTARIPVTSRPPAVECLPSGNGFFRGRLDGALDMEIDWHNAGTRCEGMPRPDGNGIRLSFRRKTSAGQELLIVLGIAGLSESSSGHALPVNVTIIEEGSSHIYGTRGDDKCTIDELRQELLTPWRPVARSYRVSGRGFCTEPASALSGKGSVLMSTFDFAGLVTFEDQGGQRAAEDSV